MDATKACRITAVINKDALTSEQTVESLLNQGMATMDVTTGRQSALKQRTGIMAIFMAPTFLVSAPVEIVTVLAELAHEEALLHEIGHTFQLNRPGRGSIYSEIVEVFSNEPRLLARSEDLQVHAPYHTETDLTGICAIVQRSQGDPIARVALNTGACVPWIYFGYGTGVRDKLGLLRIAIPAEKEIVEVAASCYDAETIMEMLIEVGRLDQPGRGFIFLFPIHKGLINRRVSLDASGHAASIEQIIGAIDELRGNAAWRSRGESAGAVQRIKRKYLRSLVDMTVICDKGRGAELVQAAMAVGAAGATIHNAKNAHSSTAAMSAGSPAQEVCSMIIGEQQLDEIRTALVEAGLFDDRTHGYVIMRPVPKACTYLA